MEILATFILGAALGAGMTAYYLGKLHTTQQRLMDETLERVKAQMENATDQMLQRRQSEFNETSRQNLSNIVDPLRETMEQMRREMDTNKLLQTQITASMKTQIEQMMRQSEAARHSADELARVFKHQSKIQGDWGETILDELLDSQGLTRGIHYDTQITMRDSHGQVIKTEGGSMMRPDVILHLDQKREVIIDSKVSLKAFMDYVNATDEAQRQVHLRQHIDSLQKHVKELSRKDYSTYILPPKVRMDYVIMFVPHAAALWTALNAQPDLWRRAMEQNVFIADEQTLFAALKIVNITWTQIAQTQNHERVFALADELIDRVGQFTRKYEAIGKALTNAQTAWEDGNRKLSPSGQSILQTCAKLQKLGAKQGKALTITPETQK